MHVQVSTNGTLEKWVPAGTGADEPALYHVVHTGRLLAPLGGVVSLRGADGDIEDLDLAEVLSAIDEWQQWTGWCQGPRTEVAAALLTSGCSRATHELQELWRLLGEEIEVPVSSCGTEIA